MTDIVELKDGESIMKVARADHEWLGVVDIAGIVPLKVKIKTLVRFTAQFEGGREDKGLALVFEKGTKKLILNATNTTTLHRKFGDDPAGLKGKEITLVVEKLKREFNGKTHGIRIK